MPARKKRYSRIAISLPSQDLAAADRLAVSLDRSRSWVVAEAIRRYAAAVHAPAVELAAPPTAAAVSGLSASRIAQLKRDLLLTPEQRVREAQETLRLTELREPQRAHQVVVFDKYEDYLQWKRRRDTSV